MSKSYMSPVRSGDRFRGLRGKRTTATTFCSWCMTKWWADRSEGGLEESGNWLVISYLRSNSVAAVPSHLDAKCSKKRSFGGQSVKVVPLPATVAIASSLPYQNEKFPSPVQYSLKIAYAVQRPRRLQFQVQKFVTSKSSYELSSMLSLCSHSSLFKLCIGWSIEGENALNPPYPRSTP